MKKKQVDEEIKDNISNPSTHNVFKITLLNTRPQLPPLTETDYLGVIVGDYMIKGYNQNTIYQVTKIERQGFNIADYQRWKKKNEYTNSLNVKTIRDLKYQKLYKQYKKDGNFGACVLTVRSVVRAGKIVGKGRSIVIQEMDSIPAIHYNSYDLITLPEIITTNTNWIANANDRIQKIEDEKSGYQGMINILKGLLAKNNPTVEF